jgi:hypothetical protein
MLSDQTLPSVLGYFAGMRNRHAAGHVRQSAVRLQGSAAWEELWRNIISVAEQLQLKTVCLDVNAPALHEGYHARWGRLDSDIETPTYWRTEIPLVTNGQVVGRLEVVGRRWRLLGENYRCRGQTGRRTEQPWLP